MCAFNSRGVIVFLVALADSQHHARPTYTRKARRLTASVGRNARWLLRVDAVSPSCTYTRALGSRFIARHRAWG